MTRVLVIGPSWVGDMVMSQSLYKAIKQQHPDATIDVMAPGWCAPILARMPEVNRSIDMPLGHGEFALGKRYQLGKRLAKHGYDHAYVLPNSAKSALIPWFAGIPTRTGWKGEMRYGLLNDLRPNKKAFQYMVERYVALAHPCATMQSSVSLGGLEGLPKPELTIDPDAQAAVITKLGLNQDRPIVGLCPGAEFGPAKKWPEQHYAEVARQMHAKGFQVWLFGSAKDIDTCEKIAALADNAPNIHVLAGKTNLIEAVDLLGACQTVVSNDSGLMHIAAAVNCQVIAIYGSTSPDYTPPLTSKVDIVHTDIECRPCFQRECPLGHLKCLKDLDPSRVISLIKMDKAS